MELSVPEVSVPPSAASLHPATAATNNDNGLVDVHITSSSNTPHVTPVQQEQHMNTSQVKSDDEVDASGSPDHSMSTNNEPSPNLPPLDDAPNTPSGTSLSSQQSSLDKTKQSADELDFASLDPELYGLRRSNRAKPSQPMLELQSDESDSDVELRTRHKRNAAKTTKKVLPKATPAKRKYSVASSSDGSDQESGSGSDFSAEGGSRRRRRQTRKKARRESNNSTSSHSSKEVSIPEDLQRFSNRRTTKVTTYNEDEDDDDLLEEDEWDGAYYDSTVANDEAPAIDAVLDTRILPDLNGPDAPTYPSKEQYQYLIKWKGKAHIHATWEFYSDLKSLKGAKKIQNSYMQTLSRVQASEASLEDKEIITIARERELEAMQDHFQVDRIIGSQASDDGTEYFVKWRGLTHDQCTWENANTVSDLAQSQIDRFLARSSKSFISNKTESNQATRSSFTPFRSQPDYIKYGELRQFQIKGVNFLAHNWSKGNNVILADEMGLGKTVQTCCFMSWLVNSRQQAGPFLVVVPLSTMAAWAKTLDDWTPDLYYTVCHGNVNALSVINDYELYPNGEQKQPCANVVLTTYECVNNNMALFLQMKWQFLAIDEAHRLKNAKTLLYGNLQKLGAKARLLITGTPIQNDLKELSALMDFLMPGKDLVRQDIDLDSENSEETARRVNELNNQIRPYILRRTKQTVENDLPPLTEKTLRIELSDLQLEYYKNILTKNYAALNEANGSKRSFTNIMMELKKTCNHPFLFEGVEDRLLAGSKRPEDVFKGLIGSSGKMMLLDHLLTRLKSEGHRVLIFCQMVQMLDIIGDYMTYRGHLFRRLDGTVPAHERNQSMKQFNAVDSEYFAFLLSTRAGGLGINLMTADTVILFDSDWNPQADLQAVGRAHRIGQKKPVSIYRFISKETVEEDIFKRAFKKRTLEYVTLQQGILDLDSKNLDSRLKKAIESVEDPDSTDAINQILKRRGQKMFEQNDNQKKLDDLDLDSILANAEVHNPHQPVGLSADGGEEFDKIFEMHDVKLDIQWDDIIPKDQLEKIKEEEKRRADDEFLKGIIAENAPRNKRPPPTASADEDQPRAAKRRAQARSKHYADENDDNDDLSDTDNSDPTRPLQTKEIRNLVRAYERHGALNDCRETIIDEARLTGRDHGVIESTLNEILDLAKAKLKEENDRLESLSTVTKKDKKAILFDFKDVKGLNAETLTERPAEMRLLREETTAVSEPTSFRIPEASKNASYTCEWGHKEDGMLCLGIAKHGFGAWTAIRDDPQLELAAKLFLDENRAATRAERIQEASGATATNGKPKIQKTPGPTHLVRRANYLIGVLKERKEARLANAVSHARIARQRPSARAESASKSSGRANGEHTPKDRPMSSGSNSSFDRKDGNIKSASQSTVPSKQRFGSSKKRDRDEPSTDTATPPLKKSKWSKSTMTDEKKDRPDFRYDPFWKEVNPLHEWMYKRDLSTLERKDVLMQSLRAVAQTIQKGNLTEEQAKFRWQEFATQYWPLKGENGENLKSLYLRLPAAPSQTNGESKAPKPISRTAASSAPISKRPTTSSSHTDMKSSRHGHRDGKIQGMKTRPDGTSDKTSKDPQPKDLSSVRTGSPHSHVSGKPGTSHVRPNSAHGPSKIIKSYGQGLPSFKKYDKSSSRDGHHQNRRDPQTHNSAPRIGVPRTSEGSSSNMHQSVTDKTASRPNLSRNGESSRTNPDHLSKGTVNRKLQQGEQRTV